MLQARMRKYLSAPGLIQNIRSGFEQVPDTKARRGIPLTDYLMSAVAIFKLKYPSLLQFDQDSREGPRSQNMKTLFGIRKVPSDTALRECLDDIPPETLRPLFTRLFGLLQRGKVLERFTCLGGYYPVSVDATGYFSSQSVHCPHCCTTQHRNGLITYSHKILSAVLVHPEHKEVFPFMPEPIIMQDGVSKNDCEMNAAKRLLPALRTDHPHLKMVVVEDGLYSKGPHIKLLNKLDFRYIIVARPGDHKFLFEWVAQTENVPTCTWKDTDGTVHRFRYLNGVPLNDRHFEMEVNFLEYQHSHPSKKTRTWTWVTDLPIDENNLMELMRVGRARWKIENETFNTLKTKATTSNITLVTAIII